MTSAVLPYNNHHGAGYNAINPNPSSTYGIGRFVSQNPNPNPSRYVQNVSRGVVRKSDVAPPPNHRRYVLNVPPADKETARDGHVIFHLDTYTRSELKELKTRLVSDLERVRSVIYEIESREPEIRPERSNIVPNVKKSGPGKKKSGKILGQKRAMQVAWSSREIKRGVVLNSKKVEAAMMRKCGVILTKLMKHKHGWVFNKPVDAVALGLHNYHQLIKHPMDLGTVKSKLGKHVYGTPIEFAADVRLIFDNAMMYNPKGDDAHTMASILLHMFEEMFVPAFNKFEGERQRLIVAHQPLSMLAEAQIGVDMEKAKPLPPALAERVCKDGGNKSTEVKKPNAPPSRREMSDEEREKLGLILQDLAGDYLNEILQIVAQRNSELASPGGDGEIELDVHALDSETMWDLEKFARLHKKAAQNRMKKEELVNQLASNLERMKSPVAIMEEPAMLKVEEDIDIGDEIPMYDYPPIEIERDAPSPPASNVRSSNSGSSSSGSDSSSDSDSSSGSDSEGSVQSQEAT